MAEICNHISETEANAAAAERRTIDRFAATLFETRLGETVMALLLPSPVLVHLFELMTARLMGYCRFMPCPMIFMITMSQLNV